jgi:uncharacterized protein (DUF302 family)
MQQGLEIGPLLPCNVIVDEVPGGSVVSLVNPISMLSVVENPGVQPVAEETRARQRRVAEVIRRQPAQGATRPNRRAGCDRPPRPRR